MTNPTNYCTRQNSQRPTLTQRHHHGLWPPTQVPDAGIVSTSRTRPRNYSSLASQENKERNSSATKSGPVVLIVTSI